MAMGLDALLAGIAPGGAVTFFLSRQKESNQRKRRPRWPCPSASLRATCDARSRGGAAELALFAALTPLKQPQRVRARSAACCAAAPAPRPALLGTARGEGKSPHGPSLRSAFGWSAPLLRAAAFLLPLPLAGEGGVRVAVHGSSAATARPDGLRLSTSLLGQASA